MCMKMESSVSHLASCKKIHCCQFCDIAQSTEFTAVNGSICSDQPKAPKHKSEMKCMQARLILTDILKTKLGQEYLNRWKNSQQKELLQNKLEGSSEMSNSVNSEADSEMENLSSSEEIDLVTASKNEYSPVRSEHGYSPTYGTSRALQMKNRCTALPTYCKRRGLKMHSQSTQLDSKGMEEQPLSRERGSQIRSVPSTGSLEGRDSFASSPLECVLPDRLCHKTDCYTLCQEKNLPPSTTSSQMRNCSVLLKGYSSKFEKDVNSFRNEDAASLKTIKKVGAVSEAFKRRNCASSCEDSSVEVVQKVRRKNSDESSQKNGKLEPGTDTPGTPQVSRKSILRLSGQSLPQSVASRRICLKDSSKELVKAVVLEEDLSDVWLEAHPQAVEQKCSVSDKPKNGERGILSELLPHPSSDKKPKLSPSELIVLSSDEEVEEDAEEGDNLVLILSPSQSILQSNTKAQDGTREQDHHQKKLPIQDEPDRPADDMESQASSVFQLPFFAVHVGRVRVESNGNVMVTAQGIAIPLKDPSGKVEVSLTLVPSQILKYGVWSCDMLDLDPKVAPPTFFFLWMTDDAASILHVELFQIYPPEVLGPASSFVLLALREPLDCVEEELLGLQMSVMSLHSNSPDNIESCTYTQGLDLIRSSGDEYLLSVLGHDLSPLSGKQGGQDDQEEQSSEQAVSQLVPLQKEGPARQRPSYTLCCRRSRGSYVVSIGPNPGSPWSHYKHQSAAYRLILFPPPPSKGGISVTTEDLQCLDTGNFLNDVIIDFYLKYLIVEKAPKEIAERSHIFSSFFYKQLTRKDHTSKEVASYLNQHRRHQRVKTWTRHVDIFNKDYLFIPVNQEAHWYLVVICFPWLEVPQSVEWNGPAVLETRTVKSASDVRLLSGITNGGDGQEKLAGIMNRARQTSARGFQTPECTELGCQRDTVCRRPCILLMDSLNLSGHERVFKLLREYLEVEWEVRKGTPRSFTSEMMSGSHCRVPLQDNSSDCGLYLLQYAESFLENPVVHFDLPLHLEDWFPRQKVRNKREKIRDLVLWLYGKQPFGGGTSK